MTFSRTQLYFAGILLLLSPFIIYRSIWLNKSVKTKGVVVSINEIRRIVKQSYPVIRFEAGKDIVTVAGHYNIPYAEGDSIALRYNPDNPSNYRIDTFWNRWVDVVIVNGFVLIFWSFLFFRNIIPKKSFSINRDGIKQVS